MPNPQAAPAAPFSEAELARRLAAVRAEMAARGLDLCLLSTPENIYYLSGLDHWGYFAPHLLIVPAEGAMTLVTRAMERVTVANQVRNAAFAGHGDSETAADVTLRLLADRGTARTRGETASSAAVAAVDAAVSGRARIGLELWSSGLPAGLAQGLMQGLPEAEWLDVGGLVDRLRWVKSAEEQALLRRAAALSDVAAGAAIEALADGAPEAEVAAASVAAMIRAGGQLPGFGPFIRPQSRLGEEHTTWGAGRYRKGEAVFLELSGCFARYHAPLGRLVWLGAAPDESLAMAETCTAAFDAVLGALKPGAKAREVYAAWQAVVDAAGLAHYRRHHCGYLVGIGFPPSWTGGNSVTGLRHDSDLEIRAGMSFHILSWLMGTGQGDHFVSNCVLLTEEGPEVLTLTQPPPIVR
ncbi:Xaa-Pro dipeptidase [Tistlia consotensis]|uniref:Xaa-Pro dipeptidase n=1 Tax=Tistlia consotensis USBA 355 TaxID=560819 RepID=A0A1Y6CIZ0_9PROT|nr:Xaa-Pro peptidase family protein [Tistlia consotensis]SMF56720.1 Xaa-Pro dipeptidase [Tistlia consotensis USBA 355]SNR44960.1 Xaa-Pro dipeptidase [Tistlia consotensis]